MRKTMMAIVAALISLTASGCAYMDSDEEQRIEDEQGAVGGTPAGGSGDSVSRSYAVSGFTGVVAAGSDDVVITKGESFAVTATGDADVLDRLVIRVDGDKLEVRRRLGNWSGSGSATVRVTMPALTSIEAAGSGSITADSLTGDEASIDIAGSGDVKLAAVAVRKLTVDIAGSGEVEATGTAETVEAGIAGSGSIAAPALTARTADIDIAGSGNVTMAVTGTADIGMLGSGDVTLTGGAECTTSKLGNGAVDCS